MHSCEPGVQCSVVRFSRAVYITPIVNRVKNGSIVPELGAGGGGGDLYQVHELELPDQTALEELEKLCQKHIRDRATLMRTKEALSRAFRSKTRSLSLDEYGLKEEGDIPLEELFAILGRERTDQEATPCGLNSKSVELQANGGVQLPRRIVRSVVLDLFLKERRALT